MKFSRLIGLMGFCLFAVGCVNYESMSNTAVVITVDISTSVADKQPTAPLTENPVPTKTVADPTVTKTLVPRATQEPWEPTGHPGIGVTVYYPEDWSISSWTEYPDTQSARFSGHDGHFHFYTIPAESLEKAVDRYLKDERLPFGSDPSFEAFQIRGQDARLIIPSSDQPVGRAGDSVVIIQLPRPVRFSDPPHNYLVLWADLEHLRKIAMTIRFTDN